MGGWGRDRDRDWRPSKQRREIINKGSRDYIHVNNEKRK